MKLIALYIGISIGLIFTSRSMAEVNAKPDAILIPLKDIWAYDMPGTRDMHLLEVDKSGFKSLSQDVHDQSQPDKHSLVSQIANAVGSSDPKKAALPGFAVLGTGLDALREAHAILVDGKKATRSVPAGSKVSLFFFTKVFDYYVHFDAINAQGGTITIRYFFVPHRGDGTCHFALIPVSESPVGEVNVEIIRSPLPAALQNAAYPIPDSSWDATVVCRPFKFTVDAGKAK